jgi:hypothetical protein
MRHGGTPVVVVALHVFFDIAALVFSKNIVVLIIVNKLIFGFL